MIFESESPGALDGESIRTLSRNLAAALEDLEWLKGRVASAWSGDDLKMWVEKREQCETRIKRMREALAKAEGGAK